MRIHRVRLRNFRGVEDSEVAFATDGVTVVEGDNEIGKTSIAEAIDLLITTKDRSKTKQVRAIQPVGLDKGPEAEVEMSTGDYRFVYSKRWLREISTTLSISAPGPEQLSGDAAHERVEAILAETLDADLWSALRIEQGEELKLPSFDVPALSRALDMAAGGDSPGESDDDLWGRICDERARYWTKGGQPSSERKTAFAELQQAQANVANITDALKAIERDITEMSRLVTDRDRLLSEDKDAKQRVSSLTEQWAAVRQLSAHAKQLSEARDTAVATLKEVRVRSDRRQELIREFSNRERELNELKADLERSDPALETAIRRAEASAAASKEAETSRSSAETDLGLATADQEHLRRVLDVEQLGERLERVIEAQARLSTAEETLDAAQVNDELLDRIEQASNAVLQAKAVADVAAASVETTALRAVSVHADDKHHSLQAGESLNTSVSDSAELTIGDIATIRVHAGAGSKETADELLQARSELRQACVDSGVADLTEARTANQQRISAEKIRTDAQETIARDRRDLTVDDLERKVRGLTHGIAEYAASRAAEPPVPNSYDEARALVNTMTSLMDEHRSACTACSADAQSADEALKELQVSGAALAGKLEQAEDACERETKRLAAARAELSDAELEAELSSASIAVDDAAVEVAEAEAQLLDANAEGVEAHMENARVVAADTADKLADNDKRQHELHGRLEIQGDAGLQTQHDQALSTLQHQERSHEREEARAQAALLLHDTFAARRQESRRRYREPFKQRIEQFGRIVLDSTFKVELNEELGVTHRTLEGTTLTVDQLSTGAREQLGILSRLACAAIVSPDGGGAPVIIDDALGWSDPTRLRGMGAAISMAAKHCQVIILTCTPGRYAHVGNASVVRLPA